jgi:hypothetical protein
MPPTEKRGFHEAVATISTTNITLSGHQTLNGYLTTTNDRVFVSGQSTPADDGIYLAQSGAWVRAEDALADGNDDLGSAIFKVEEGTEAGKWYTVTAKRGAGVVGTNALPIAEHVAGAAGTEVWSEEASFTPGAAGTEVWSEEASFTPGNFTATIVNTPTAGTERVYRNGVRQNEGGSDDYTISGTTITFAKKLTTNEIVLVDYKY